MPHVADEQLQRLTDGSLEAEQSETLWSHLEGCETCLNRLQQRIEENDLPLTLGEEAVVSNTFQRELMRRINQDEGIRAGLNLSYTGLTTVFSLLIRTGRLFGSKLPLSTKIEMEKE